MRIELSNVRKKIKESSNVTKIQSHMMFGITQSEDETIKCKKKKKTAKCDKSTVKCDVGIAQREDGTVKYEKK